jgi:hypothetical protein
METTGDLIMKIGFSILMVGVAVWVVSFVRENWNSR